MISKYEICDSCETVQHCSNHGCIPLQPAQHQPVAIVAVDGVGQIQVGWITKPQHNDKLYTQPPAQQEPLTLHEIVKLTQGLDLNGISWVDVIRAVETAHGIGN